jgi:hypothetical protein
MSADETARREVSTGTESVAGTRRPWWPIGLALLGLVLAVLAGANLVGRQFRPSASTEPAAPAPTGGQATGTDTVERVPTAAASGSSTSTSSAAAPGATATMPGLRANSSLEREIEAAYYRYLQVYSEAVLNLETNRLGEVLDGDALRSVAEEVNDRKARGRPLKVIEDDRLIAFGAVTETQASVIDEYTSRSVVVDATTGQPLPRTSPPTRIRQTYALRKVNAVWKIVDGTREVLGEANR